MTVRILRQDKCYTGECPVDWNYVTSEDMPCEHLGRCKNKCPMPMDEMKKHLVHREFMLKNLSDEGL